jgi:uncharacterized BrkB/YihY/UPF0761 family membrane protein
VAGENPNGQDRAWLAWNVGGLLLVLAATALDTVAVRGWLSMPRLDPDDADLMASARTLFAVCGFLTGLALWLRVWTLPPREERRRRRLLLAQAVIAAVLVANLLAAATAGIMAGLRQS